MRSVSRRSVDKVLWLVAAALAAGCASNPVPQVEEAVAPAAASAPRPVDAAAQLAFDKARLALAAGRTAEAESAFLALTQSHPDLGGPHAALGALRLQAGQADEAVAQLEAAVAANPKQAAWFNQLGVAYRQQGRFDKARDAYEHALVLAPDHAMAMLNLGILNDLYLGDSTRALELYERYLVLTPSGDATVGKWVVEMKNRKPQTVATSLR